jgi:hypothetical protein
MKIEVTDATTLPAWLQGHVSEGHLDLGALAAPEDVSGLKTALSKERGNAAAYSKYGSPDDIDAKFAELTEKAKGSGKGSEDAQARLDAMEAKYTGELTEANTRFANITRKQSQMEFMAELAKSGAVPDDIEMIAGHYMKRISIGDDGQSVISGPDGGVMLGTGPNHTPTMADLAREIAEGGKHNRNFLDLNGKGGGGKPAGSQGGTPDKPTVTRDNLDAMTQDDRMTFFKSGGAVKD